VNFINEQNSMGQAFELLENSLESLLKVTTIFGSRQQ